ncbi:tetratricopeptide repeat protein [Roseisalinus antarcticus]|uniref:Tetratricopeptide repeat protein n=1 Tax=Roseisalinus antarcticus TaxID=254357 RepID=A0A1Y5TJZ1_9RHOB|nr:tetratricopeptide repeat-containing glycosyltransferase family protein [Roseisalinus antarcticus]SLN66055.1 Tetratricopeptide repeat protein [Roseisalinus antarcticus]
MADLRPTPDQGPPLTSADLRHAATDAHQGGDLDKARGLYARYLATAPRDSGIWSNLGALHRSQQRHDQAVRAHARAHALDGDSVGVLNNYANALTDIGLYDQAIPLRRKILEKAPNDVQQKALIGRAMRGKGDYPAAIAHLEQVLKEHPDDAETELQLAFALLGEGIYDAGFEAYRARWRTAEMKKQSLPFPKWEGEDLTGKTVLVMPEQGFGDAVLMVRFLPALKARCARVVFLSERPMARLFSDLEGVDQIVTGLEPSAPIDCYLNIMDLPRLALTGRDDIPPPARMATPPDSLARAASFVRPFPDAFKVGVVWTGSTTYKGNVFRSFSHTDYLPLVDIAGVQLFSLYKGPLLGAYREDGSDAFMIDTASTDRDFADCAATMAQMDLIVTSDTATAHIAGSMGLPCWVILHWDSFWVYTHSGEATPWYPSMRLFRQPRPRDWATPLGQVRDALAQTVAEGKGRAASG